MSNRQLKTLTLREQFIAWLRSQNPRARYNWKSSYECACGRFANKMGHWESWCQRYAWGDPEGVWDELDHAAMNCTTYGALLKKLTAV